MLIPLSQDNKVIIEKIRQGGLLEDHVQRCFDNIAGIENIFRNKKILIKPNIARAMPFPYSTSPLLIEAIIKSALKYNPKEIYIGEGSGEPNVKQGMQSSHVVNKYSQQMFEELGYADIAAKYNARLIDLNFGPFETVEVPNPIVHKYFIVNSVLTNIDTLITVPIFKSQDFSVMTLNLKSLMGMLPCYVYGFPRYIIHHITPKSRIARTHIDICKALPITLSIIDALHGLCLEPVKKPLGCIVAGRNPASVDSVGAMMAGFNPYSLPHLRLAEKEKIGIVDPACLDITGRIDEVKQEFDYPNFLFNTKWGRMVLPIQLYGINNNSKLLKNRAFRLLYYFLLKNKIY